MPCAASSTTTARLYAGAPSLRRTTKSSTTPSCGPSRRSSNVTRSASARKRSAGGRPLGAASRRARRRTGAGTCPGRRPRAAGRAAPRRRRGSRRACRSTRTRGRAPAAPRSPPRSEPTRADWNTTSPSQSSPIAARSASCSLRRRRAARGRRRGPPSARGSGAPAERANSHASSAVRRLPRWSVPVGLGAKRPSALTRENGSVSAISASRGAVAIALGVEQLELGPLDPDVGIVVPEPRLGRRVEVARDLVDEVRHVREHAEPVAEADRDEQLEAALVVEPVGSPTRRRSASRAADRPTTSSTLPRATRTSLPCPGVRLEVDSAHGSAPRARVVVLDEVGRQRRRRPTCRRGTSR